MRFLIVVLAAICFCSASQSYGLTWSCSQWIEKLAAPKKLFDMSRNDHSLEKFLPGSSFAWNQGPGAVTLSSYRFGQIYKALETAAGTRIVTMTKNRELSSSLFSGGLKIMSQPRAELTYSEKLGLAKKQFLSPDTPPPGTRIMPNGTDTVARYSFLSSDGKRLQSVALQNLTKNVRMGRLLAVNGSNYIFVPKSVSLLIDGFNGLQEPCVVTITSREYLSVKNVKDPLERTLTYFRGVGINIDPTMILGSARYGSFERLN